MQKESEGKKISLTPAEMFVIRGWNARNQVFQLSLILKVCGYEFEVKTMTPMRIENWEKLWYRVSLQQNEMLLDFFSSCEA